MYLRYHTLKKDNGKQEVIFYALCVLYVLSVALIALDTAIATVAIQLGPAAASLNATVLSVSNNSCFLFFSASH